MDITFRGRHTDVAERFRDHATAKLARLEKLDAKAIRVDVEVSVERNPRQASQKERVELTIRSRGPAIRAEAAAEDRFSALDLALAKLDARLRRALDRRKIHHGGRGPVRLVELPELEEPELAGVPEAAGLAPEAGPKAAGPKAAAAAAAVGAREARAAAESATADTVPIPAQGAGPLLVRQKFHHAEPMTIDQALLEMELVGHDFYLFQDAGCGLPSVVYRRRGYEYGVLRLVEDGSGNGAANGSAAAAGQAGQRLHVGERSARV